MAWRPRRAFTRGRAQTRARWGSPVGRGYVRQAINRAEVKQWKTLFTTESGDSPCGILEVPAQTDDCINHMVIDLVSADGGAAKLWSSRGTLFFVPQFNDEDGEFKVGLFGPLRWRMALYSNVLVDGNVQQFPSLFGPDWTEQTYPWKREGMYWPGQSLRVASNDTLFEGQVEVTLPRTAVYNPPSTPSGCDYDPTELITVAVPCDTATAAFAMKAVENELTVTLGRPFTFNGRHIRKRHTVADNQSLSLVVAWATTDASRHAAGMACWGTVESHVTLIPKDLT